MISVDVGLVARPRILGPGASISLVVDPTGGLGTDKINNANLTDKVSAVVDFTATLTGGYEALSGDISAVVDASAARTMGWPQVPSSNNQMEWWTEDSPWYMPLLYVVHPVVLSETDAEFDPPTTTYELTVHPVQTVNVGAIPSLVVPDPPAPAPPAPPEDPGNFPMPTAGGLSLRVLHGVVVDMDTPTITDGIPHS